MSTMPSFLTKNEENSILFKEKDKELQFFVPEKYFERGIAEIEGDVVSIFGVFDYTIVDLKTNKNSGLKSFRLPTLFSTKPASIEKRPQIRLISQQDPTDYRILKYREGDVVILSTKLVQHIGNVEKMSNLFLILGYIVNTIPYDQVHDYILEAMSINGFSYGINNQVIGFVVSELCRSKDDPSIPYRLSKTNDLHAYKSMSVKNIPKLISPYTAILAEDFDESIMYAMMNDNPQDSSLEKVLVGQ